MLSAAALVACNTGVEEELTPSVVGQHVVVSATIGEPSARVVLEEIDDPAGDYIKVDWKMSGESFIVFNSNQPMNMAIFTQTESTEDSPSLFEGTLPGAGPYVATFPALASADETIAHFANQQGVLDESLCIMTAYSDDGSSFHFQHGTSILRPTFKVGEELLANNQITRVVVSSSTILMKNSVLGIDYPVYIAAKCDALEKIYLHLLSKEIAAEDADRSFDVVVTTSNAKIYTGQLTVPEGKTLLPGKFYTPTISLSEPTEQLYNSETVATPDEEILGEGTAENPYVIYRAGDLKWLLENAQGEDSSEQYYAISNDFKIESDSSNPWSFCDPQNPFMGVLDGQGHTIRGELVADPNAITVGFVGYNKGEIENLNLNVTVVGNATLYDLMGVGIPIGGVGAVAGLNQGTIDGCTSSGTVSSAPLDENGLFAAGGLVGVNVGIITNSTNTAAVEAAPFDGSLLQAISTAGGIAGGIAGGAIVGCTNSGTIEGAISSNMSEDPDVGLSMTAGIVGLCMPAADVLISGCKNTQAITGAGTRDDNALANDTYTAGIVGFIENTGMGASVTITNCENSAPITGGVSACCGDSFAGGIVGVNNMANISNCVNTAAATITAGDAMATQTSGHNYEPGYTYAGGIVANHRAHMDDNMTWVVTAMLSDCENYAAVNGPMEGVRCYLGGIAGSNEGGHPVIERCKNYGAITGRGSEKTDNLYMAGIAGNSNGSAATIANCENHGTVTGGISGYDNHTAGIAAFSTGQCSEPGYEGWIARIYGCTNKSTATITPGTYLGYGNEDYIDQLWVTGGIVAFNRSLVCSCCVDETNYGDGKVIGYGDPMESGEHNEQDHINISEV